jgi:uncharacterized membrane protein
MAVLATIGAIDTGAITITRWGWIGTLSCPGGTEGGCDRVLNSAWGSLAGQPLSLFGFLAYVAVILLALLPLLVPGETRRGAGPPTWWALLVLTSGMAVFSVLLMGLLVFKIQAFCFFCVLSAVLSLALLVLTLVGGGWSEPGKAFFRAFLTGLLVLLVGLAWASAVDPSRSPEAASSRGAPPPVTTASTPATLALAEHLSAEGAVMYSAYWCPHCHEQKMLFGKEAAARLTIIECSADGQDSQRDLCQSKGVMGFPSWEIDGQLDSGVKPLETLARLSGYEGPDDF